MNAAAAIDPSELAFRVPPHDYEAEQALLGALLVDGRQIAEVAEQVRPQDFGDPCHGRIYAALLAADERGEKPSPVTLKAYFERDGQLAEIGGTQYLASLCQAPPHLRAVEFGRVVRDLADRRSLIDACMVAVGEAYDPRHDVPAKAIVEKLEGDLTELAADAASGGGPQAMEDIAPAALDALQAMYRGDRAMLGLPTGFARLDKLLGGLLPGALLLLGGRPSMGKSVLGENIARHVASIPAGPEAPAGVTAVFSLEMTREEMFYRALAARTEIPFHAVRQGRVRPDEFERLVVASDEMRRLPLYIDDTPGLTVSAMRARARRLKRRHGGLRLIVIDHLHLVAGSGENRNTELAAITKALKGLAKELGCPVLLLAQLNRSVEQREDKRPLLADLRESGAIEQDADVVMFVYREQYYLERAEPHRRADESDEKFNDRYSRWQDRCEQVWNMGEVIVAKQRNGPVGTVRLGFKGQYQRFENLADEPGDGGFDG